MSHCCDKFPLCDHARILSERGIGIIGHGGDAMAQALYLAGRNNTKIVEVPRNEKGYPLNEDGSIDWALTSKEKQATLDYYTKLDGTKSKRTPLRGSNFTPKKKKRK